MAWIDRARGQCFKVIPCLCEAIFISILQMEPANDRNNVMFSGNLFRIFNNVSYSRVRTACDYHQSIFCLYCQRRIIHNVIISDFACLIHRLAYRCQHLEFIVPWYLTKEDDVFSEWIRFLAANFVEEEIIFIESVVYPYRFFIKILWA